MYLFVHVLSVYIVSLISDFVTAATTFAAQGIVLEISLTANNFFYCNWWSDFSHEEECLFLGGLTYFYFTTIRNIPKNKNYKNYIGPITMLDDIIGCSPLKRKPKTKDRQYLAALMEQENGEMNGLSHTKKNKKRVTPTFVKQLFHHYVLNVKKINISMDMMNTEQLNSHQFGYKMFTPLFMIPNTDMLDTGTMVRLFQNLEHFVLYEIVYIPATRQWGYGESIFLNEIFIANIMESIILLNSRSLSSSMKFKAFKFVKPKSSISTFINNYQQKFNALNWYLSQQTYKENFWGDCDECLSIAPLSN